MKKTINIVIVIILALLGGVIYIGTAALNRQKNFENIKIEGKMYKLRTAKRSTEWAQGLMFVKKPVDYDGMIFYFPDKQVRSFWNMNTLVDLDIYWMRDGKVIEKSKLPSVTRSQKTVVITSPKDINQVVEIIK